MIFSRSWSRISWPLILEAAAEIVIITLLCLLPLAGVAFSAYLHQPAPAAPGHLGYHWLPFSHFLDETVTRGQLAFYAISNWATVIWLCGKEYKRNLFPGRVILGALSVCGFYYCAILIDPAEVAPNAQPSVFVSSAIVYLVSMACYFMIALFGKIPAPSAEDTNQTDVKSLREKLHQLRGNDG
jgi:hypothetical protein